MKTKVVSQDEIEAKLIALSVIYEKEESRRQAFLKRLSYTPSEKTAILDRICDPGFRSWVVSAFTMMKCSKTV